jgi:hypothetical protein
MQRRQKISLNPTEVKFPQMLHVREIDNVNKYIIDNVCQKKNNNKKKNLQILRLSKWYWQLFYNSSLHHASFR